MGTKFAIILESETTDTQAELRNLRLALKKLGRAYKLRCKSIRPLPALGAASSLPVSCSSRQTEAAS